MNITGYSTALFSTWYFVEELGILFDAGDGVTSGLLHKARKLNHVFVSHADRDHLTGLLQFNQLNAREGFPIIHFPRHCSSFPFLEEFSKKFDPHIGGTIWNPIEDQRIIQVKDDISVLAIRNNHVPAAEGIAKSLSYKVYQSKTKLKPEIAALPKNEIVALMSRPDKASLSYEVRNNILSYSGDTPVEEYERFNNSKILIHEATFLAADEDHVNTRHNKHSRLDEVLKMVSEIKIEKLILGHFSSRYDAEQIDSRIRMLCTEFQIQIPVYRVLPGQIHRNILMEDPINA